MNVYFAAADCGRDDGSGGGGSGNNPTFAPAPPIQDFHYLQSVARQWCPLLYLERDEEFWPCDADDLVRASRLIHTGTQKPFVPPPRLSSAAAAYTVDTVRSSRSATRITPADMNLELSAVLMPSSSPKGLVNAKSWHDIREEAVTTTTGGENEEDDEGAENTLLTPLLFSQWLANYPVLTREHFTLALRDGASNPRVRCRPQNLKGGGVPLYVRWRRHAKEANEWYITYSHVYAYNGGTAIVGAMGAHEADLEHVTMHVRTGTGGPNGSTLLAVYYSQHYGGEWVDRSALEYQASGRPVVYVARSSHASYPRPGTVRRFYGLANDVCSAGHLWDARNNLVFLDCDLPRQKKWMLMFRGDLGNGHVSSFVSQSFWNATDVEHNSGTGWCFSIH